MSSTTVSATGTASASPSTSSAINNGGGGPNSPLLFFVALGFGVVFTNLWIIVGVKYCFRYNARNRQRMMGEDPDAVDLGNMPQHRRRRREKKLMTIDEVNEKFPLMKYKTWRSNRAEQGLSTAGGINGASRPPSVINMPISTTMQDTTRLPTDPEKREIAEHKETVSEKDRPSSPKMPGESQGTADSDANIREITTISSMPAVPPPVATPHGEPQRIPTRNSEEEEDDHIESAVPAEQLPDPGDACAICIDTLEDDDDVRGLTCGHAFHASCVDPWLTSRRACCPLCKADYYVPKPRPEGAEHAEDHRRRGTRGEAPGNWAFGGPQSSFLGGERPINPRNRPTLVWPGRIVSVVYNEGRNHGFPRIVRGYRDPQGNRVSAQERIALQQAATATAPPPGTAPGAMAPATNGPSQAPPAAPQTATAPSWRQRFGSVLPNPRRPATYAPAAQPLHTTPGQLEAGRAAIPAAVR